jgi:hypothetical protein
MDNCYSQQIYDQVQITRGLDFANSYCLIYLSTNRVNNYNFIIKVILCHKRSPGRKNRIKY